jgi:Ca-activated chloride channel family protein
MSVLRDAAERLIDAMRDEDLLGLVTFSDVAQRDLPLSGLGGGMRHTARQAIRALRPDASTNLADGLRLAFEQFSPKILRTHICKVLVITDGQANVGVRDADGLASVVAPAADRGLTLSAIGVGLSYDAAVLGAISRAGNGEYHHIESAVGIDALLRSELDATAAVSVRGVDVLITAGNAAIGTNLNGYRQTQTAQGVQVVLGDLARPREIWIEVTSPVALSDDVRVAALARGTAADDVPEEASSTLLLRVTSDLQSVPEDPALVRELAAAIRAQGVGEAAEQYDTGNVAAGQQRARAAQASFARIQANYASAAPMAPIAELDQLASAPAAPASQEERRRLKELAARSNAARRGRKQDEQ